MSETTQRFVLWALAILLVGGTILALRYARGYRPLAGLPGAESPLLPGDVGIRFENMTVAGRDGGKPAWTIRARQVETTRTRSHILFSGGVAASLLPGKARPAATVTASRAAYDAGKRTLSLHGDILCAVRDLRVRTNQLSWDAGSRLVRCPGAIRATDRRGTLSGENFAVNIRTREYTLRNIHLRFPVNEAGDLPL